MNRKRRKIWPTGPATYLLAQATPGWLPPSSRLPTTPRVAPTIRPSRILVWSFIPFPLDAIGSLMSLGQTGTRAHTLARAERRFPIPVRKIDSKPQSAPDAESDPGSGRKANHDVDTCQRTDDRHRPD